MHWRDSKYAQDNSTSIEAVQEFIQKHPGIENLALIQCTSPFISSTYLKEAFNKFSHQCDCVFSAVQSFKLRWKIQGKKIIPVNFDYEKRPRRQVKSLKLGGTLENKALKF